MANLEQNNALKNERKCRKTCKLYFFEMKPNSG